MVDNTKTIKLKNNKSIKIILTVLLFTVFILYNTIDVYAASNIKLYNYTTKKNFTYKGKSVNATYNGKKVTKDKTPGIIIDNTSMVSYKDVFVKSDIKADYKYNKSKQTVTLSANGNTLILTIGSKTAQLNGKKITLPVAPVKIKYITSNTVNIMVPASNVAQSLGFQYTWNNSTVTSIITSKKSSSNNASSNFVLSYDGGKPFEYSGTKGQAYFDQKKISLGQMPSVIVNNTAMLRAKKIFSDVIGADYNYDKATKTLNLTLDDKEIKMTIGSKTAYLNNKVVTLESSPMIIKNHQNNTSYIMVPGRSIANLLGYNYSWDSYLKSSFISTKKSVPELGDDPVERESGTILRSWKANGKSNNFETDNIAMNIVSNIYKDAANLDMSFERYVITSDKPFGKISHEYKQNSLLIKSNNSYVSEQLYEGTALGSSVINNITTTYVESQNLSEFKFNLNEEYLYDIEISEDGLNLYIILYKNKMNQIDIGTTSMDDYITFSGITNEDIVVKKDGSIIYIDFINVYHNFNDISESLTGSKYIDGFYRYVDQDGRNKYMITLKEDCNYFTIKEDNQVTVVINKDRKDDNINIPGAAIVQIPLPNNIDINQIVDEDMYYNNKFVIRLPGNYDAFYKNTVINNTAPKVKNITIGTSKGNTEFTFNTSSIQGYKTAVKDGILYIAIANPKVIYKNIVVLDPGHGGGASGAVRQGVYEKNLNFKMLYTLGSKYFNSPTSNIKAYYTRVGDYDLSLSGRANFASSVGADLFVSLHMNSTTTQVTTATGTEVYYSENNNKRNAAGLNSKTLAQIFVDNITARFNLNNRGVKPQRYTVVHNNSVPAVLIELGYMSNPKDLNRLTDAKFQEQVAEEIYNSLSSIFMLYPTGR